MWPYMASGLSRGGGRAGDILSAAPGPGAARCAGDRGADGGGHHMLALGFLEMLRPATA